MKSERTLYLRGLSGAALLFLLSVAVFFFVAIKPSYSAQNKKPSKPVFGEITHGRYTCHGSEKWEFSSQFDKTWSKRYKKFLKGDYKAVLGFSLGYTMRAESLSTEQRFFASYWISRSLYEDGFFQVAASGFSSLMSEKVPNNLKGIQIASAECLARIRSKFPTIKMNQVVRRRVRDLAQIHLFNGQKKWARESLNAALVAAYMDEDPANNTAKSETVQLLKGAGESEYFVKSLYFSEKRKYETVIKWGGRFLTTGSDNFLLENQVDTVKLLVARAYYALGHFARASQVYKDISRSSNLLTHSLNELTWSYLKNKKYQSAVGTSINLKSGSFRKTFTPESNLVMAMALNEICQYPEAMKSIALFRKKYKPVYSWLTNLNKKNKSMKYPYYEKAISFLKGEKTDVPIPVITEWVRSPFFISRQDEINNLFKGSENADEFTVDGYREQKSRAKILLSEIKDVKEEINDFLKIKGKKAAPKRLINSILDLQESIELYLSMRKAGPVWLNIRKSFKNSIPARKSHLLAKVDRDMGQVSKRMLKQLNFSAENIRFVEVEIFEGASSDIIWQNAHPNYREISNDMKAQGRKKPGKDVWDWGTVADVSGEEEVWEDELGSFKVDLYDNCSNKERFLALKANTYRANGTGR